jgi:hypothetical protein
MKCSEMILEIYLANADVADTVIDWEANSHPSTAPGTDSQFRCDMRCTTFGAFFPFFIARSFGKHAAGPLWESVKQKVRHGQVQAPKVLRHTILRALHNETLRGLSTLLFAGNWSTERRACRVVNNGNVRLVQSVLLYSP